MKDKTPYERIKDAAIGMATRVGTVTQENDFLNAIIQDTEVVVYIAGMDGNGDYKSHEVIWMNDFAIDKFGNGIGKQCFDVFHDLPTPCDFCNNDDLLKNPGKVITWIHFNKKVKGLFLLTDFLFEKDGKKFRIESAREITGIAKELIANHEHYKELLNG